MSHRLPSPSFVALEAMKTIQFDSYIFPKNKIDTYNTNQDAKF